LHKLSGQMGCSMPTNKGSSLLNYLHSRNEAFSF
jgi:hypothetical protein